MPTNLTTQLRRWQALDNALGILMLRYENESISRREYTIYTLLAQLRKFGKGHFHFFYDGLGDRRQIDLLPVPDDADFAYPGHILGYDAGAFFLERILDQMAQDIAAIQSASDQRELSQRLLVEGTEERADFSDTLIQIDKLALNALRMIHVYLDDDKTTALTYFRRSANVRVIPYAPVALIGIPITAIGINRGIGVVEDLLVIPHEIAHHLYWNGKQNGMRIRDIVAEKVAGNPVDGWTEEIFADVVGTLIAGPVAARSMIDMQLAVVGPEFVDAGGVHPTPALRPLIYAYTLDKMGMTDQATEVRNGWQAHLDERSTFVNRQNLYAAYAIIDDILEIIDPNHFAAWLRWSENVPYDQLYSRFAGRLDQLVVGITADHLDPPVIEQLPDWRTLAAQFIQRPDLEDLAFDWVEQTANDAIPESNRLRFTPEEWIRLFDFGGWTTEGPNIKGHG